MIIKNIYMWSMSEGPRVCPLHGYYRTAMTFDILTFRTRVKLSHGGVEVWLWEVNFYPLRWWMSGWMWCQVPLPNPWSMGLKNYPIISAIGSPTEKNLRPFFLQPLLMSISSYIEDTGHFLYILQHSRPLPQGTLLVTCDVTSLYTNIPLAEAERAVAHMLIQARPHARSPSNQPLLRPLHHVFQGNIFSFSDGNKLHYYLQVNGISMGSKWAPYVACIFMGDFKRTHIHRDCKSGRHILWHCASSR